MIPLRGTLLVSVGFVVCLLSGTAQAKKNVVPESKPPVVEASPVAPELQIMSPLDVKDADIQDVMRTISKAYNINLLLDKDVVGKITVHLSDVPVIEGIQTIARSNNLEAVKEGSVYRIRKAAEEQRTIINFIRGKLSVDVQNIDVRDFIKDVSAKSATSIVPDSKVDGKVSGKLYNVELEDGLRAILEGNGYSVSKRKGIFQVTIDPDKQIASGSGGGGGMPMRGGYRSNPSSFYIDYNKGRISLDVSNGSLQDVIKAIAQQSDMEIITYGTINGEINAKLKDVPLTQALALLLGGTMFTFVQKDSIILIGDRNSATPSGQALSKSELIPLKCIKADGVLAILPKNIPAMNIRVVKEQNALLVSGTSEDIVAVRDFIETVDIPTPQVSIRAVIVEYKEQLGTEFGLNALKSSETIGKSYKQIPFPATVYTPAASSVELGINSMDAKSLLDQVFRGSYARRIIGKLPDDFFLILRAMENESKAKVLAQPQVMTLNGNKASINVNETQYFEFEQGTAENKTTRFQPITFGIKLDITPWISRGGQITTEISPEVSNSDGPNPKGYPNVSTRSLSTTVRVKDGETIILGGLIQNRESNAINKIPLLGDIPFIGFLFQYKTTQRIKSNLAIFITPTILASDSSSVSINDYLGHRDSKDQALFEDQFGASKGDKNRKESSKGEGVEVPRAPLAKVDTVKTVQSTIIVSPTVPTPIRIDSLAINKKTIPNATSKPVFNVNHSEPVEQNNDSPDSDSLVTQPEQQ